MSTLVRWIARLAALLGARRADDEMTREMRAHLDLIADDLERQGMAPEAARVAARRAFGGLEQVREQHRDARSIVWIEQLLQDLRHAVRGLRKSPGFSIAALLSIVLGVGVGISEARTYPPSPRKSRRETTLCVDRSMCMKRRRCGATCRGGLRCVHG